MPRWDKFFQGAAEGVPTGYRMGLAYQEEQRAKAQDVRAAAKHEKDLRNMDQVYNYNEVMNPLLAAHQGTANKQSALDLSVDEQYSMRDRKTAAETAEFNLQKDKKEYEQTNIKFDQEQKNLAVVGDTYNALYGPAPGMGGWSKFLSSPAPKDPEQLVLWKQGKLMMDNPGFKRAFTLIQQIAADKRAGVTPEVQAQREKAASAALKAGGEQVLDVFEAAHKKAVDSGKAGAHHGVISSLGVNLSGLTLRDGFLTNTTIDDSGAVTLHRVFPAYDKNGKQVGFRREQWKTYSAEDVQDGVMRDDLMSWGVDRTAPSEAAAATVSAGLDIAEKQADIAAKWKKAGVSPNGASDGGGATERMEDLSDIAKDNPTLYRIFSNLSDDEFSKVSSALDNMEGDTLTNMMTAVKSVRSGLDIVKKGGKYQLKNPNTGALIDPEIMPFQ